MSDQDKSRPDLQHWWWRKQNVAQPEMWLYASKKNVVHAKHYIDLQHYTKYKCNF